MPTKNELLVEIEAMKRQIAAQSSAAIPPQSPPTLLWVPPGVQMPQPQPQALANVGKTEAVVGGAVVQIADGVWQPMVDTMVSTDDTLGRQQQMKHVLLDCALKIAAQYPTLTLPGQHLAEAVVGPWAERYATARHDLTRYPLKVKKDGSMETVDERRKAQGETVSRMKKIYSGIVHLIPAMQDPEIANWLNSYYLRTFAKDLEKANYNPQAAIATRKAAIVKARAEAKTPAVEDVAKLWDKLLAVTTGPEADPKIKARLVMLADMCGRTQALSAKSQTFRNVPLAMQP